MFIKIKNVPKLSWSSDKPLNLKPKISTFFYLCFGLTLFGLGEGLLIVSASGASPWSVLAQGLFLKIGFSVGLITIVISLVVLLFWFPLKQKPGIGTILNALIIGLMIDVCIRYVPTPENYINQILLGAVAIVIVGLGGGIYLVANLGAGPRDGLMIGLQKKTNLPIALVRGTLEITVMSVGWYLGGTVGVGTLLFAFGIGPCVALSLFLVNRIFN
ncbi:hypothetical protein OAM83_01005 [Candidatus Pelagibacter sp.]|nr:hypothetical protein [Candidatus Pelagibacter sp.]